MTESLSPKYMGLLAWILGICGTRLLPSGVGNLPTLVVLIGFLAWFGWVSQRAQRSVRQHLEALPARRGAAGELP
jgi:hypothetical protein